MSRLICFRVTSLANVICHLHAYCGFDDDVDGLGVGGGGYACQQNVYEGLHEQVRPLEQIASSPTTLW
jgi:hypothetical protein